MEKNSAREGREGNKQRARDRKKRREIKTENEEREEVEKKKQGEKKREEQKKHTKKNRGKNTETERNKHKEKKQKGRENDLNSRFKNACLMMEKLCKEQSAPCHRDICGSTCFYEPKHHVNHQCKAIYSPPCR